MNILSRFELIRESRRHLGMYALVDGLGFEQVMGKPLQRGAGRAALFDGTADAPLSAAGPWLVDAAADGALNEALLEHRAQAPFVSWLFSEAPFHGLVQLLQLKLDVRMPDGQAALLRFYDPRVLRTLAQTLSPAQREEFFAHIVEWHFEIDGEPMRIGRTHD